MKVFNLPDDLFTGKKGKPDSIIFHNYCAPIGTFNGKGILNRSAISLVISGEKTMHFAEKIVTIKKDEFHFLSTGNCLVSMKLSPEIQFKSILIFFEDSVLINFFLKYDHKVKAFKSDKKIISEPYVPLKKDAFVLNFINSLQLLFEGSSVISSEMKQLKLEELLLHILEKYPYQLLSFQILKNRDLNDLEIRRAVETNITSNISLPEMAFICNVSLSTFKRRFEKIYGTSPNKWFLQKRMELAKELLLHHREKPSEVFHKVGYENHSSFSQSFKQAFGLTPKEFQLQH
jgi:AraC-like DNA-binding protein